MELTKEKSTALLAARDASKVLLHYYGKKAVVRQKPNKSLVAEADLSANEAIIKAIKKGFPTHSILSEETGFEDNKSDYKWVIDPLDGTHNFLHNIPFFGVSIALECKNKAVLGVLSFPVLCITAVAEKNKGAFINGKRAHVSGKKNTLHPLVLFESSYKSIKEKMDFFINARRKAIDLRTFGSAVYNLLLVAAGNCDGFVILSTNEWDVAAGFLIVEEAGGKITGLNGENYNLRQDSYVISNGCIHNELLRCLK